MKCGQSDQRNLEFSKVFSEKEYFLRLVRRPDPVILDVGGHRGESIMFFKEIFPDSLVHSFEPDPENFVHLDKMARRMGAYAHNVAISDVVGAVDFYAQDATHLGGLYPINRESSDSLGYAASARNRSISVEATTLQSFIEFNRLPRVDLLKIDAQGAEELVLRGAGNRLDTVVNISVECSLFDFYGHARSLYGVESVMNAHGFRLWDIYKISKNLKNWRTDWAELVYIRSSPEN